MRVAGTPRRPLRCVCLGRRATGRQSAPLHLPEPLVLPTCSWPHPDIVASTGAQVYPHSRPEPGLHQPPPHHPLPAWTWVPFHTAAGVQGPAQCLTGHDHSKQPPSPAATPHRSSPHSLSPRCSWVRPSLGHQPLHRTPLGPHSEMAPRPPVCWPLRASITTLRQGWPTAQL